MSAAEPVPPPPVDALAPPTQEGAANEMPTAASGSAPSSSASPAVAPAEGPTASPTLHRPASKAGKGTVRSLLLWTNPITSALVLTGILGGIYVLSHYSPVRIITFALSVAIFAHIAIVNVWVHGARMFTNADEQGVKKPPTMWWLDRTNRNILDRDSAREYGEIFADLVNVTVGWTISIVAVDNNARSFEALVAFLALYWLSGVVSGWTLLTTIVLIAFTAPAIYLSNKGLIDNQVGEAQKVASHHIAQADTTFRDAMAKFKAKLSHKAAAAAGKTPVIKKQE